MSNAIDDAIADLADAVEAEINDLDLNGRGRLRIQELRHEYEVAEAPSFRIRPLLRQVEFLADPDSFGLVE